MNTALLGTAAAVLLTVFVYQVVVVPIGTRPAPDWFYFAFLVFLGLAVNFSSLALKITDTNVKVGYGVLKHVIPWYRIDDCYIDEASAIRYGGWGIRVGGVGGKWRMVYSTVENPRIVLRLRWGRFDEFVFSTRNPEEVLSRIHRKIGREI